MPKLPGFESQRQLTTQQPQFLAPKPREADILSAAGKAAGQAANIAVKWGNALNTIQATTAKANYESGLLDIYNRAADDPDYNNSEKYLKEIEKLKTDSLKGFSNKATQSRVALDFDFGNQAATLKIGNIFKKKTIEVGQVSTYKLLDVEKQNYPLSPETSEANINSIIDAQVKAGVFGPKEAYKLRKDTLDDAKWEHFLSNFMLNPDQAEKDLKAGKFGLSTVAKSRAITHLSELRRQVSDDQNNNAHDLTIKLLDGSLLIDEIDALENALDVRDRISLSDGESLRKALVNKIKTDSQVLLKNEKKAQQYFQLLDQFIDDGIDRTKFRQKLLQVYQDGIVTSEESKFLSELKQNLEDIKWNRRNDLAVGAIKGLKSFLDIKPNLTDGEIALKLQQLLGEMATGADPDETSDKIKKETLKEKNDWINNVPENGMILEDRNGKKIKVFPDGHTEDVK